MINRFISVKSFQKSCVDDADVVTIMATSVDAAKQRLAVVRAEITANDLKMQSLHAEEYDLIGLVECNGIWSFNDLNLTYHKVFPDETKVRFSTTIHEVGYVVQGNIAAFNAKRATLWLVQAQFIPEHEQGVEAHPSGAVEMVFEGLDTAHCASVSRWT